MKPLLIRTAREDFNEGMYGQALTRVLEGLHKLEAGGQLPDGRPVSFNIEASNYGNIVPRFVIPKRVFRTQGAEGSEVISLAGEHCCNSLPFPLEPGSFTVANRLFYKYFDFHGAVKAAVDALGIRPGALGVHYRGTDKNFCTGEANMVTKDEMAVVVRDYLKNNNVEQIFCCSDEQSFVDGIKRAHPDKVVALPQFRSKNATNGGLHHQGQSGSPSFREHLTMGCLADVLALAKCDTVIKTSSAMSSFARILNPSLKLYTVSAMKQPWFPAAVADQYPTTSPAVSAILRRTMRGDSYNTTQAAQR